VISDSILLEDEITRRFINFVFRCMHFNSTYISSIVRSPFTNMNSLIGKNVSLCALKYGNGEGDVGCSRFSKEFFVQHFIYGLPREVLSGGILRVVVLRTVGDRMHVCMFQSQLLCLRTVSDGMHVCMFQSQLWCCVVSVLTTSVMVYDVQHFEL